MSGFDRGDRFERLQSDLLRARAKIRELEAELALAQVEPTHRGFHNDCPDCIVNDDRYRNLKARAEKAEAELAKCGPTHGHWNFFQEKDHFSASGDKDLPQDWKARAEKAEKALGIVEAQVYRWSAGQRDTEQRLADSEARVAELEVALRRMDRLYAPHEDPHNGEIAWDEAREREESK